MSQVYEFRLVGTMPLIMHADHVDLQDEVSAWIADNKKLCKAGDDRTPAWKWQTYLHSDGEFIAIPQEVLASSICNGASKITLKKNETFKKVSQSDIQFMSEYLDFFVNTDEGPIQLEYPAIVKMKDRPFVEQLRVVREMGFDLLTKRVPVSGMGSGRHVRVRPIFRDWYCVGKVLLRDGPITPDILVKIFESAGRYGGLGDWRPSAKHPGPYGMFDVEIWPEEKRSRKTA